MCRAFSFRLPLLHQPSFLVIFSAGLQPAGVFGRTTWGVAPGYDSARLQRDVIHQRLISASYVDTA